MRISELQTPALLIDAATLEGNLREMARALPGARLRPHVKAHKCTALAQRQAAHGHMAFTCATAREALGMAAAGLGADLLLANELLDPGRLAALAALKGSGARITVAIDSEQTLSAAAAAGIEEVLVDVNVGLPRCGCAPELAARLAEQARGKGLRVRGVMGYEGHLMLVEDRAERDAGVQQAMQLLLQAHREVGGEVISAGGTGSYDLNRAATEIQAGSYALMDTAYAKIDVPFQQALGVLSTVLSVSEKFAVADCGLKALGMDHGNPEVDCAERPERRPATSPGKSATVWFCSDEHITFAPEGRLRPGDRVRVRPAHVDPTLALHERVYLVEDEQVLETWQVDLRGW